MFRMLAVAAVLLAVVAQVARGAEGEAVKGNDWYVAPDGKATNAGSREAPWDLLSAFAGPAAVKPGDTIWLRGGTYSPKTDRGIYAKLNGAEGKPVSVRQMPGERATINLGNNSLWLWGTWTNFYDFEVCSLEPKRSGFTNAQFRFGGDEGGGGQHCKAIGLIIHDLFNVGYWRSATDSEMHGCIVYNNGVAGHGHSLYVQGIQGHKDVTDSIFLTSMSRGIAPHGSQFNINLNFEGNISFSHGGLRGQSFADLYNWAAKDTKNLRFVRNMTYHPLTAQNDAEVDLHQGRDVTVQDNYIVGGREAILLSDWDKATVTGNTIVGGKMAIHLIPPKAGPCELSCDRNAYFMTGKPEEAFNNGNSLGFEAWKALGYDANSTVSAQTPKDNVIFVRKNKYEEGRANICIYNWRGQDSVKVNVADVGLKDGDTFEIRDAQNWFGKPVATGKYTGADVEIPMTGLTVAQPSGDPNEYTMPRHTGPEFGAFVILKTPKEREK